MRSMLMRGNSIRYARYCWRILASSVPQIVNAFNIGWIRILLLFTRLHARDDRSLYPSDSTGRFRWRSNICNTLFLLYTPLIRLSNDLSSPHWRVFGYNLSLWALNTVKKAIRKKCSKERLKFVITPTTTYFLRCDLNASRKYESGYS